MAIFLVAAQDSQWRDRWVLPPPPPSPASPLIKYIHIRPWRDPGEAGEGGGGGSTHLSRHWLSGDQENRRFS